MSVSAVKATHTDPRPNVTETPAAIKTQEDRRVKEAAHVDPETNKPVRSATVTVSGGVHNALVSLKKGG